LFLFASANIRNLPVQSNAKSFYKSLSPDRCSTNRWNVLCWSRFLNIFTIRYKNKTRFSEELSKKWKHNLLSHLYD